MYSVHVHVHIFLPETITTSVFTWQLTHLAEIVPMPRCSQSSCTIPFCSSYTPPPVSVTSPTSSPYQNQFSRAVPEAVGLTEATWLESADFGQSSHYWVRQRNHYSLTGFSVLHNRYPWMLPGCPQLGCFAGEWQTVLISLSLPGTSAQGRYSLMTSMLLPLQKVLVLTFHCQLQQDWKCGSESDLSPASGCHAYGPTDKLLPSMKGCGLLDRLMFCWDVMSTAGCHSKHQCHGEQGWETSLAVGGGEGLKNRVGCAVTWLGWGGGRQLRLAAEEHEEGRS